MSRVRIPEGVPSRWDVLHPNGNFKAFWLSDVLGKKDARLFAYVLFQEKVRPVGQAVKTAASHAANGSAILPRVTKIACRIGFELRQDGEKELDKGKQFRYNMRCRIE